MAKKKNRKQRKAERTKLPEMSWRKVNPANPMGTTLRDYADRLPGVRVDETTGMLLWSGPAAAPKPKPKSTLPPAFTDLLKVDKPTRHSLPPKHAKSAKWEDLHEFHPQHTKPSRSSFGLNVVDPPLAFVCPECDHRQAPLTNSGGFSFFRPETPPGCGYCGVTLRVHGTRVLWWR